MKENIEANKEKVLSKTLATILLDCPVVLTKTDYELSTQMSKNRCFLMS
jgi:DNA polymerase-1